MLSGHNLDKPRSGPDRTCKVTYFFMHNFKMAIKRIYDGQILTSAAHRNA